MTPEYRPSILAAMKAETISQWSMSRLNVYEECPRRAFFAYTKKIPEPDRGTPPNGKEWPNDRGTRVHDEMEQYVKGLSEMPPEAEFFAPSLKALRNIAAERPQDVILEQMWGITTNWEICGPFDDVTWGRIKMDALVLDGEHGVAIDYKTGKRKYNEVKHGEQLVLYVIGSFLKYPQLQTITGELWYLDQHEKHEREYTRNQAMHFIKNFDTRAIALCEDKEFHPKPSTWSCRFCPYGPGENKTNHCEAGIQVE